MGFVCDPSVPAMVVGAAPAEQFGPYLVYERLGVGGMATVHRALERGIEGFERIVALKRLLPHLAEDASFIKAFVREAKLASLLNHVHIVQIFELGRVGTEYFISMEYIDGRDIRRILRHARRVTGPPPIHVTVGLLLQLCEALDYAHTKVDDHGHPLGLVHRDVSPSNLLITKAGHLKVIDFGIAKAQSSQLRTQTGRVKGKLAYMAPEAIAGKDLDARSDLFAVGVIGHELLTARPLFASKNEYQTLLKVQRGDIMPPSTFNQACPAELDALVLKALARDPNERYSSAAELRDELHALRRLYNLQTGHRDISQWIDWAFSVEPPSGGFAAANTFDSTGVDAAEYLEAAAAKVRSTPGRRRDEEEAAVELAWGGGEAPHEQGPVVLDDVPDVSAKHLTGGGAGDDDDDLDDDIPASQPSHGPIPRARAAALEARAPAGPPQRPTLPGHGTRPRQPSGRARAITDTGPAERTSNVVEPQVALSPSGMIPLPPEIPPGALETMRNLPPVSAARVRAESVAPRDLPSLEPFLPPAAPPAAPDPDGDPEQLATVERPRPPSKIMIGQAIVARRSSRGSWVVLIALLVVGAIGAAAVVYLSRGAAKAPEVIETRKEPPRPPGPARTTGTVKFQTMPVDAEITVEGHPAHQGSPWTIELPAGVHQITIQRGGYKAWLTSLELSANESSMLRVVLEPLGGAAASSEATLTLVTTPPGLEVVLDGQLLEKRTPLKMPLKPGRHVIVVQQDGVEMWRQTIDAKPAVDYEFSPSMTEDKQRERAERSSTHEPLAARRRARIVDVDRAGRAAAGAGKPAGSEKTVERTIESPSLPSISTITPEPPPPPAPTPSEPAIIAPTAVTRTGGATPTIHKSRHVEVPAVVNAKVCIDTSGRVTRVTVLTRLERTTARDLTSALEDWTYTPYKPHGTAVPACFVVSFRAK